MPLPPLNPDRWIVAYQEPDGTDLRFATYGGESSADAGSRALHCRGCKVHAVRTQADFSRALAMPLRGGL